jgi:hypothetical protein
MVTQNARKRPVCPRVSLELMSDDDQKIRDISIFLLGLTCADESVDCGAVDVIEAMMAG